MEVSSDSRFWKFHQNGVDGESYAPCRNLRGEKNHGKSRGCKTRKEVVENRETATLSAMRRFWLPGSNPASHMKVTAEVR